jgi:hypothetical protein
LGAVGEEAEIEIRQFLEMEYFAPSMAIQSVAESGKELSKTSTQAG